MIGEVGSQRAAWIGIAAGLCGLVACGQPAPGTPRLICPNCIALDSYAAAFGGISRCSPPLTAAGVPDTVAQQVDVAGVLDLARGAFESDLRWELGPNPPPSAPGPRGYWLHPRARGTIAFGDPMYYAGPPATTATYGCWGAVKVPAVVSVSTDDGAIAAETNGALNIVAGDFPGQWMLETYADLTGSLAGRLEAARAVIGVGQPHPARWSSGADVSVTVDVDVPARGCMQDFAGSFLDFAIDAPGRIGTSDGRVATVVQSADFIVGLGPNSVTTLDLTRSIEQTTPASFEAQAGISDIDAAGSPG